MEPKIDYSVVDPVPHQKTVSLVNSFVLQTVEFLNRFSSICEEKLDNVSNNIRRLEVTVTLLEAKLDSIQGLGSAPAAAAAAPAAQGAELPPSVPVPATAPSAEPEPEPEPEPTETPISQDSEYVRFFKMTKVGVPVDAVKGKMEMEGFDSSALERPDEPARLFKKSSCFAG